LTIDTRYAAFTREPDEPGRVRLEAADQVCDALAEVYEAARPQRPGLLSRTEGWWRDQHLYDPDDSREGATKFRYAVYREAGRPLGYAQYRVKSKWTDFFAEGTVQISELFAVTPAAYSALWRYLLGIDLVTRLEAWNRPVDDALPWLLIDPRRARYHIWDSLWVRLVDVAAALESRCYRVDGRLVFEVTDDFCPRNQGRFVLEGGPEGATCAATNASPDLSLDVQDLGALYLGGNRAETLGAAGRIGGNTEAIALAGTMFDWEPQPWCPEVF
jgi:predicted acetyltransferase